MVKIDFDQQAEVIVLADGEDSFNYENQSDNENNCVSLAAIILNSHQPHGPTPRMTSSSFHTLMNLSSYMTVIMTFRYI